MDLISEHLYRVSQERDFGASAWCELLDSRNLEITWTTLDSVFRLALASGRHEFQKRSSDNLFLLISGIPAVEPQEARSYFTGGYLHFLEQQGVTRIGLSKNVAHWIICGDTRKVVIHLTFFPLERSGGALFAVDLLQSAELDSLGME